VQETLEKEEEQEEEIRKELKYDARSEKFEQDFHTNDFSVIPTHIRERDEHHQFIGWKLMSLVYF